jgi:DNA-binding NtrC family response regulator
LRERFEELPALIAAELKTAGLKEGKNITAIHPHAMDKLLHHKWPGNLRELSHTVRTMTLFCDGSVIMPEHVAFPPDLEPDRGASEFAKSFPTVVSNNQETPGTDLSMKAREKGIDSSSATNQNQRHKSYSAFLDQPSHDISETWLKIAP